MTDYKNKNPIDNLYIVPVYLSFLMNLQDNSSQMGAESVQRELGKLKTCL